MKTEKNDKLKMQSMLSGITAVIGVILMIYMITIESEPGAIPLLLTAIGTGWYFLTRYKIRSKYTSQ
jgi:hypothetical protein